MAAMTAMTDTEAAKVIEEMFETAVEDVRELYRRIEELRKDFQTDPWEDTAAQIKRLEARHAKRAKEAAALAIASMKF